MAEMLTDLLTNIYNRIAQLGKSIQELKTSLDGLNANIEEKVDSLSGKMAEFSREIEMTQTKHVDVIKDIGSGVSDELKTLKGELGLNAIGSLISNLKEF